MKRLPVVQGVDRSGHSYWRSLNELNQNPEYLESLAREFPDGASEWPELEAEARLAASSADAIAGLPSGDDEVLLEARPGQSANVSRRGFLGIMGAAMALAGATACRRPEERIVPYTRPPEEVIPGEPLFFATAVPMYGTAYGLLVESHDGRPTKIEGNPRHPESLGAATTFLQASVLDLYDPDRSPIPREREQARSWQDAEAFLGTLGARLKAQGGRGLAILTEAHRSPTLQAALQELRAQMPSAKVVRYEPFAGNNAREGAEIVFGRPVEAILDVARARVILSLDSDFMYGEQSPIKAARGWVEHRNPEHPMNRLYVVESSFTVTGGNADHRLRLPSKDIAGFASALASALVAQKVEVGISLPPPAVPLNEHQTKFVVALAKDLAANRGAGLIVAGDKQPPAVHALVHLLNQALGNDGRTVRYVRAFDDSPQGPAALAALAKGVSDKTIDTLVILGGNPAFTAPGDLKFAELLKAVPNSVHLSSHVDETSALTTWHLNRAHYLESWGDVRAQDGTASIIQPLIAPLFGGKTDAEVVRLLLGDRRKAYELVQETWARELPASEADFAGDKPNSAPPAERKWRRVLHHGFDVRSAYPAETLAARATNVAAAWRTLPNVGSIEVTFCPDHHAWDGRHANNGWLQELPDPIHKQSWGNSAWISPAFASQIGVVDGELVTVTVDGASVTLPVLVAVGQADQSIGLTVGQGRRRAGRVGTRIGSDVYPLLRSSGARIAAATIARASGEGPGIARTQEHFNVEGRPLAREGTVAEYRKDPEFAEKMVEHPPLKSLWKEHEYPGHKWGLAVDLNACIGCNACMVACQAENNIPLVGIEGVKHSREMHWLRIDRYFEGTPDEPTSVTQPMLCQQCENAPCEQVCPVAATAHSTEGLNDMAYNRCIGTRYCANNCPYKVRRFNFYWYHKGTTKTQSMQFNPDVTVRGRGVMEKCTWCVQRINRAKIETKKAGGTRVRDGAIKTACQQSCPTEAIIFGDLNDQEARASKLSRDPRAYALLGELNTKPRLSYLARIRNPNPELAT